MTKHEDFDLAQYEQYAGEGWDNFGEQELLKPPSLSVSQPTSEHEDKGVYYISTTGTTLGDRVRVVPLHVQRRRDYSPGGYDSPRVCWSNDFLHPASDVSEKQNDVCAKRGAGKPIVLCPMAQWKTEGGKRVPAPCSEYWSLAVALLEEGSLEVNPDWIAIFHLRSMALGPARRFMGQYRTQYRRLPMFGAALDLELSYKTKKEGFAGNFYTPDFPDLKDHADRETRFHVMPPETLAQLHELSQFFRAYFEAGHEEAEAHPPAMPPSNPTAPQPVVTPGSQEAHDWGA